MRKRLVVTNLILVLILTLFSAKLSLALSSGRLLNGGFEQSGDYGSTDYGLGWSHIDTQYGTDNLVIDPLPAAHSGTKSITLTTNEGEAKTGAIVQTIQLKSGTYDFTLSGWTWIHQTNPNNGTWIRADLYADTTNYIVGDTGWFGDVGSSNTDPWFPGSVWNHITNTFTHVTVSSTVSLVINQRVGGYLPTGHGTTISDGWALTINKTP